MLDYMYIQPKDCPTCNGSGKFKHFPCPDCEYRDLWQKAEKMVINQRYIIKEENIPVINRMVDLFGKPNSVHRRNWIIVVENKRVIRKAI